MPLFDADLSTLVPADGEPEADRAPDEVAAGTPEPLRSELEALLGPDRVLSRAIDLIRYASDASPYRLIPKAVVMATDADDVAAVLAYGRRAGVPVTLRSGGTSLNGQSQGDGILVDVRRSFRGASVEEEGAAARVRPGTALGHVNRVLAPHGRKLGPDPASTDFATAGGVVANNSGGMRCGVVHDSYRTVRGLTFVLPSGTVVDSLAPGAEEHFAAAEPKLARGLEEIRDELRADSELAERVRRKFEIKNTTGYRLCAFLDADTPLEIFRRLLVGSEGTLAFTSEIVFDTVPLRPHMTTTWIHFKDIDAACEPVPELVATGATAVELMVAPALLVAANTIPGTPEHWKELAPDSAALLLEYRSDDPAELDGVEAQALETLGEREMLRGPEFTRDAEVTEVYWRVREGMHGIVGRLRPQGTSLIVEDVCVPPARIAESAKDISALLGEHGFLPGVAGHASAGNLHFMLTPKFSEEADRDRYEAFMSALVDLVLDKYDGSLKAEHGTGVNMAPYVEREWGAKATEMMWRIKQLADPDGVLAPGVVLNRDPGVHLRNLRSNPQIEDEADTCVECGFCEPVCPSRWLTTTPRQRIVVRREIARQPSGSPVREALLRDYDYDALETCAADGSCALACPLGIDTGKMVKEFRERVHGRGEERAATWLARHWRAGERGARGGLRAAHGVAKVTGDRALLRASRAVRRAVSYELVPEWPEDMPAAAQALPATDRGGAVAVYFPACINRIFDSASNGGPSLPAALVEVSKRAGSPVWIPPDVAGRCCATPWASKGYSKGAAEAANRMVESLWRWTGQGELPVIVDASSCTQGVIQPPEDALTEEGKERHAAIEVIDSIEWAERLLPSLSAERVGSVAVHPTCSARHLDLSRRLVAVAEALADEVFVPPSATCCGFAGDRGFLHPELTAAATADAASELASRDFDAYVSSNRTCELGMARATGQRYESIITLLERVTR